MYWCIRNVDSCKGSDIQRKARIKRIYASDARFTCIVTEQTGAIFLCSDFHIIVVVWLLME